MRKKTIFTIAATSAAILIGTTVGTTLSSSLVSTKNNFSTVKNLESKATNGEYSNISIGGEFCYLYTTTAEDLTINADGILSGYSPAFKSKIENGTPSSKLYINLEIPANVTGITRSAFEDKNSLSPTSNYQLISVDMRKATGLLEIQPQAFAGNPQLRRILFNDALTIIGSGAFSDLALATTVLDLSKTKVTTIGDNAFKNSNFSFYFLPDTVTTVGTASFQNTTNRVTSRDINLPKNLVNKETFEKIGIWTPFTGDNQTQTWPPLLFERQWELKAVFDQAKIEAAFIEPTIGKTQEQVINEFNEARGAKKEQLINQIFQLKDDVNAQVDIKKALRNFTVTLNNNHITIDIEVSPLYKADKLTFTTNPNPPVAPDTNPDNNGGTTPETNPDAGGDQTTPPTPENPETNPNPPVAPDTNPDNNGGTTPETNPDNNGGTTPDTNPDAGGDQTTPPQPEPEPTPEIETVKNNNSIIIGSAVGGAIFLIILITVISLIVRKRKSA